MLITNVCKQKPRKAVVDEIPSWSMYLECSIALKVPRAKNEQKKKKFGKQNSIVMGRFLIPRLERVQSNSKGGSIQLSFPKTQR